MCCEQWLRPPGGACVLRARAQRPVAASLGLRPPDPGRGRPRWASGRLPGRKPAAPRPRSRTVSPAAQLSVRAASGSSGNSLPASVSRGCPVRGAATACHALCLVLLFIRPLPEPRAPRGSASRCRWVFLLRDAPVKSAWFLRAAADAEPCDSAEALLQPPGPSNSPLVTPLSNNP